MPTPALFPPPLLPVATPAVAPARELTVPVHLSPGGRGGALPQALATGLGHGLPRVAFNVSLRCQLAGVRPADLEGRLTTAGLSLRLGERVRPGLEARCVVEVGFGSSARVCALVGLVVWSEPTPGPDGRYGLRIAFSAPAPSDRETLEGLLLLWGTPVEVPAKGVAARREARVPADEDARYRLGEGPWLPARVRNLSSAGLFLETDEPLPPGTRVQLSLRADDAAELFASATVRWWREETLGVTQAAGMGLQLAPLEAEDARRYEALVNRQLLLIAADASPAPASGAPPPPRQLPWEEAATPRASQRPSSRVRRRARREVTDTRRSLALAAAVLAATMLALRLALG